MMSGGESDAATPRMVKVANVARERRAPAIRPKAITPPRSATPTPLHHTGTWLLPPVRTPLPRAVAAKRPVLLLVDQDESVPDVASVASPSGSSPSPAAVVVAPWWTEPRSVALVVASVLVAALTTTAVVWTASARRDAAEAATESVGTTTLASASLVLPAPPASATPAAAPPREGDPAIPEVDVNRLPSAPNRVATGSAR